MGTPRFTPEFKEEAVRQITERGYSVADVLNAWASRNTAFINGSAL
jgi:transposase-like protein